MPETLLDKLLKYHIAIGRFIFILINNLYCIPTYCVWMFVLLPVKRFNPVFYYKVESVFYNWLLAMVSMWSHSAGYRIIESGDDIEECLNKRTLVLCNHQSTADVPLLMANFNAKDNVLPNIMWIMDRLFKYTNFGIVSVIHQDFFIASGRENRDQSLSFLKKHIENSFLVRNRKWMVLFPEGGFLRKRKEVSQRYARKNNLPLLEYVTLPRVGALKTISDVMSCLQNNRSSQSLSIFADDNNDDENNDVDNKIINKSDNMNNSDNDRNYNNSLGSTSINNSNYVIDNPIENVSRSRGICSNSPDNTAFRDRTFKSNVSNGESSVNQKLVNVHNESLLDYILDITIAYPEGIPLDLPTIVHGLRKPCNTHMMYRLYKFSEIPKDSDALTQWLYDRFVEKNYMLENFYRTGELYFNRTITNATIVQQDLLRFILINIFFITSTYFHYHMLASVYSYGIYLIGTT